MRRLWILMVVGLLVGVLGATLSAQTPPTDQPVFGTTQALLPRDAVLPAEQIGTLRTRLTTLDLTALHGGLRSGSLALNFFDDITVSANLAPSDTSVISTTRDASQRWVGTVDAIQYAQAVVILRDGVVDLRVLTPAYVYYVQTVGDGVVRISEIEAGRGRYDENGLPIDDAVIYTPTEAELAAESTRLRDLSTRADDGAIIDILAAYTPAAAVMLGGDLNAQLAIEGAATLTNLSYANSGVNFRIRLVGIVRTEYVEQGFNDLNRLQGASDGFMDELHALRNSLKADMVTLTPGTAVANRNYCGIANLPLTLSSGSAFSITEAHCINDITYAHELGHNMGKAHDRSNAGSAIHSYAYGYQDVNTGIGDYGDFVTVMAYSTNSDGEFCPTSYQPGICPAIAWWSDPAATFTGKPLGRTNSGNDLENNARSLNETALAIANYRVSDDGGSTVPTAVPTPTLIPLPTHATALTTWSLNGGFEIDADSDGQPDAWKLNKHAQKFCDTATNLVRGLTGACSLRLSSGARATQFLTPQTSSAGDVLTVNFEAKGKNVPVNTRVVITVTYATPTAGLNSDGRDILTITLPVGTVDLPAGERGTLTLADSVTTVKIQVIYPAGKGNLRVDSFSLTQD